MEAAERVVFYEWCVSFVFVTLRRPTGLVRLRPGERGVVRGLPWTLLTLTLGWWAIPWGLIYTPLVLWTNLTGGREVTLEERMDGNGPARGAPEPGAGSKDKEGRGTGPCGS